MISDRPSVTLSEILQLALPMGSQVLAGERGLDRRVHWARSFRARTSGLGSVEPGELLILPVALLDSLGEPRVLPRLIGELVETGVSALVVSGEPRAAVVAACQDRQTPLIQVPSGIPLADLERAVVGLILDRDAQLRRRAEEVYSRLLETMLSDAGLARLIEALAEATGLRAAVLDDYLSLQACAPDEEAFKRELAIAAERVQLRDPGGPVRMNRAVSIRFGQNGTQWTGQLHPLQIGAAWAGYLGLIGRPGQVDELDRLLGDRAAKLVALELAKQRAVAQATQRWRGEFLDDLLEGNFPTEEAVLARGRQLGYDLLRPHLTFTLSPDPAEGRSTPEEGQISATRQRRRFAEIARAAVSRNDARAMAVDRDGLLIALAPAPDVATPSAAVEQVELIRSEIESALPGIRVSAGIGRQVNQARDIANAQREAAQALGLAQKLLGGGQTVHYEQLGVERLLVHLLDHPALETFALETLGDLMSYDAQHRAELVHTVEVFLRCNGNHVRAAQELHLHRNTLLYRLERAREILGRDLEDAETRLALQVALRVRGTIASLPPQPSSRRVVGRRRRAG